MAVAAGIVTAWLAQSAIQASLSAAGFEFGL
jgi:hypothetical protein